MLNRLIARTLGAGIQALTGARAIWLCKPTATRRVYYGNHASHGDFVMIWSALPPHLRRRARPVAGSDYWNRNALRRYLLLDVFNGVLIDRGPGNDQQAAIEILSQSVEKGASLIVFPEGTRNLSGGLLSFKTGIFYLAQKRPDLEFIPVWIDNLARAMPKGKILPLPLLCTVTFGEPVMLRQGEDKTAFIERTRNALLALAEPLKEGTSP